MIREVPVHIEKIVERIVTKEVPIDRTVYKELSPELHVDRHRYEEVLRQQREVLQQIEVCCIRSGDDEETECCCGGNGNGVPSCLPVVYV